MPGANCSGRGAPGNISAGASTAAGIAAASGAAVKTNSAAKAFSLSGLDLEAGAAAALAAAAAAPAAALSVEPVGRVDGAASSTDASGREGASPRTTLGSAATGSERAAASELPAVAADACAVATPPPCPFELPRSSFSSNTLEKVLRSSMGGAGALASWRTTERASVPAEAATDERGEVALRRAWRESAVTRK